MCLSVALLSASLSYMTDTKPPKKPALQDWHVADIKSALEKAGWSLRGLAKHHGYKCTTVLSDALRRPWPKGERIIADAIGVDPATIWPKRYAVKDSSSRCRESRRRSDVRADAA